MFWEKAPLAGDIVAVRGGGDLATGTVQKLYRAGMRVVILEVADPTVIRRTVALCTAVTDGEAAVEDMTARLVRSPGECAAIWREGDIPILVDPVGESLRALRADGLVDAILAKRNLGTRADMAPIVIGLGPGFDAPRDVHAVVETMRGHTLGRVILEGAALPNTGIPGMIGGKGSQRVLRAPGSGTVHHHSAIGDILAAGQPVFSVGDLVVNAPFAGVLRGLIREGMAVPHGMKCADIDPRTDSDWHTISDKARCIGGGVLEAYLYLRRRRGQCV